MRTNGYPSLLFVCAGIYPLTKTSVLADVCAPLPGGLVPDVIDVRLMMPGRQDRLAWRPVWRAVWHRHACAERLLDDLDNLDRPALDRPALDPRDPGRIMRAEAHTDDPLA